MQTHCAQTNTKHHLATKFVENKAVEKEGQLSEGQRCINAINESVRQRLKYLFINTYGLMFKGRPYSEYEFLISLDKVKGLEIGNTYLNRRKCMEFSNAIASLEIRKFQNLFKNAKFFTTIVDESTDIYRLEKVITFIRFAVRGKIHTKFLGIDDVIRANSVQITDCILRLLKNILNWTPPTKVLTDTLFEIPDVFEPENSEEGDEEDSSIELINDLLSDIDDIVDDDIESDIETETEIEFETSNQKSSIENSALLVGLTSDGANVLTGKKSGVNVRLREQCNNLMLNGHCVSHRCQLHFKKTVQRGSKHFDELNKFLEKPFVFHKTSNVISNVFREAVKTLKLNGATSVIRVNGTR